MRSELAKALDMVDLSEVPLYVDAAPAIWKISHGTESTGISDGNKKIFMERNVVVVHSNTKAKATSKVSQGQTFMETIKKGDYFYLCYGSSIQLLGQFTSESAVENPEMMDGWFEREYRVIARSNNTASYDGTKKWWTPNDNSTCIKVDESDHALFEELILQPYFGMSVEDLFNGANEPKRYWWLTANPKIWSFADIKIGEEQSYTLYNENGNKRRVFQNFLDAKVGDIVIGYEANPVKKIVAIAEITQANDGNNIYFAKTEGLSVPIEYSVLKTYPELEKMEFFVQPNGSLFKLTKGEFDFIMDIIREENPVKPATATVTKYTKKREQFNVMIDDCMAGKIDRIITKSISRFARNTLDYLKYVRQLRDKNIDIYFEKENIHTLEASGELLLTIMASLAQQESASLSQNIKLGLQFRYQEGKVQVNHNHFLGYTKDENGKLIIDEEEAKIVRRIYREYLEGASMRDIAEGLEADGILTGGKHAKWYQSTVKNILVNEKYMGDALLQKTITTDFMEKTRIKNDGSLPQYYVKDNHEAIIPKDIYTQVQEEMARRTNIYSGEDKKRKRIYSSRYALSSICTCTRCGDIYRRFHWNNRGKESYVWRCCTRSEKGPKACDAPTVYEPELQMATVKAINLVTRCQSSMMDILKENIRRVLEEDGTDEKMEAINELLSQKQKELVKMAQAKKDYTALADEVDSLRDQKQAIWVEKAQNEGFKKRIKEMETFLSSQSKELTEYDETMVRLYIERIRIYDDRFEVTFKAGITVDVQR